MALDSISTLALLIFIALASFYVLLSRAAEKLDPREPPEIKSAIPVLGHVVGILSRGVPYFVSLSRKNPDLPAFTINIPQAKTYIVTSPALLATVQRNARNIAFEPFLEQAAGRISGCTQETVEKIRPSRLGGAGGGNAVIHAMHPTMLGDGLDAMNESMVKNLKSWMDELARDSAAEPATIDLFGWCKEAMTTASTDSVWGPMNPYKSQFLRDCFWEFESGLALVALQVAPHIIARKAWKAREAIVKAFTEYFANNGAEQGSLLAKARWKGHNGLGIPLHDISRLEVSLGFGLLSNTIPTTFWLLFDLYSRPEILEKLRDEIRENALHTTTTSTEGSSQKTAIIDLADIRDRCPLLVSTFQESIRFRSNGAATRYLFEDILLDGKYLLKKGSTLQMPSSLIHSHSESWGSTSADFDATRFLRSDSRKPGGFLGFGISPSICPGRHFASSEILSFTAALLMRFDFAPVTSASTSTSSSSSSSLSSASWVEPPLNYVLTAAVTPPGKPCYVTASPRDEYKGFEWDFRVTRGKGQFGLVIG